jgi:type VI secretion system protein ImpG
VVSVAAEGAAVDLGPRALRVPGLFGSDPLFPWPALSPHGVRVATEWFTLRGKFAYFELEGLDRAVAAAGHKFEVCVRFRQPPPMPGRLGADALRLHCVAAVNLFTASAEPLHAGLDARPRLLRAAGMDPAHMEVVSVESVVGITRDGGRLVYPPLHAFRHLDAQAPGFYKLERRAGVDHEGTHTWLSLHRHIGASLQRMDETLSIELSCSNRALARSLAPGDSCEPSTDLPAGTSIFSVGPVAAPSTPALGSSLSWELLTSLACSRRSLSDLEVLRASLALYVGSGREDDLRARVHRAQIDALRSVRCETVTRVVRGGAARGSSYSVALDERAFGCEGEAYAFGALLHALFSIDARINSFAELELQLQPSQRSYRFEAEHA